MTGAGCAGYDVDGSLAAYATIDEALRSFEAPSAISRLAEIATDQWGLVTRRQAEQASVSPATLDRLTADGGLLDRVARGVYASPRHRSRTTSTC